MMLGGYLIERIKTRERELKVGILAVDPVNDIAVLGSLDDQAFAQEAEDFENFCQLTKPVTLCRTDFEISRKFRVHIYTHKGTWVTGTAMQCNEHAKSLYVKTDEQIEGGTSGGQLSMIRVI